MNGLDHLIWDGKRIWQRRLPYLSRTSAQICHKFETGNQSRTPETERTIKGTLRAWQWVGKCSRNIGDYPFHLLQASAHSHTRPNVDPANIVDLILELNLCRLVPLNNDQSWLEIGQRVSVGNKDDRRLLSDRSMLAMPRLFKWKLISSAACGLMS